MTATKTQPDDNNIIAFEAACSYAINFVQAIPVLVGSISWRTAGAGRYLAAADSSERPLRTAQRSRSAKGVADDERTST